MDKNAAPSPKSLADALFGKTRKAVIAKLFGHPERSWHLRELAREADVSPTMLGKEIDALSEAGIVLEERDGNRRLVKARQDCPIFEELRGIARKTAGVADIVKEALAAIEGIECAFVFGSVAKGEERAGSDLDVCVVGDALNREVLGAMASIEQAVGRIVNPVVYTLEELRKKHKNENRFVSKMLGSKKMFLIGDEDGLKLATA